MKARRYLLAAALMLLGSAHMVDGSLPVAAVSSAGAPVTITLRPVSSAMASCLPYVVAAADIVPGPSIDTLTLHASGLPPFAGVDLVATHAPRPPYGLSWPLSIAQVDAGGTLDMRVQTLLLGASAGDGASHLVLFFDRPDDAPGCAATAHLGATQLQGGRVVGPALLGTVDYPLTAGPLAAPAFAPPGRGISTPSGRFSLVTKPFTFTTACTDPQGWAAIRFIDFRLSTGSGTVFLARLDRPAKRMYLYDSATHRWTGGLQPGTGGTLQSPIAQLLLKASSVLGTNGATGRVLWTLRFAAQAAGESFQQSVRVVDMRNQTQGWTASGTWSVK
jgi:hypothetical protein